MTNLTDKCDWKCRSCGTTGSSYCFNGGKFKDGDMFRCGNCGKINYFNPKRISMFLNEYCVELRDIAALFENQGRDSNAKFLLETIEYMSVMNNRIIVLQDAIQSVLDDSESGEGWGPDVTVCEKLRAVMPKIVTPNK